MHPQRVIHTSHKSLFVLYACTHLLITHKYTHGHTQLHTVHTHAHSFTHNPYTHVSTHAYIHIHVPSLPHSLYPPSCCRRKKLTLPDGCPAQLRLDAGVGAIPKPDIRWVGPGTALGSPGSVLCLQLPTGSGNSSWPNLAGI